MFIYSFVIYLANTYQVLINVPCIVSDTGDIIVNEIDLVSDLIKSVGDKRWVGNGNVNTLLQ